MNVLVIGSLDGNISNKSMVEILRAIGQKPDVSLTLMSGSLNDATDSLQKSGVNIVHHHPKKKIDKDSIKLIRSYIIEHRIDILYLLKSKSIANGIRASKGLKTKIITYRGAFKLYWYDPFAYLGHFHPRVNKIVCLTDQIASSIKRQLKYAGKKTVVIPHGFEPNWFDDTKAADLQAYDIPKDAFVVSCIANNRPVKGVKYLIQAAQLLAQHKNVYFIIIGRKIQEEVAKEVSDPEILKRIKTPGFVNVPQEIVKASDVYVQPSILEGLGRSIAEAMSMGTAIIATRSGGPEALIEHQKSGVLVKAKDSRDLANAILELHENPEKVTLLGSQAQQRIKSNFSMSSAIEKYYNLFKSLSSQA